MAAAEVSLLATFGNALDIIKTPALLQQFLSLPQPAVLALLQSPKLTADAEATVILLLSAWVGEAGQTVACPVEQVEELRLCIRYSRLSLPYLTDLCDQLTLTDLTRKQLMELWAFQALSTEDHWASCSPQNPERWYLPRRPLPGRSQASIKLKLAVSRSQLEGLLAGIGKSEVNLSQASDFVYSEGFLWGLELAVDSGVLWCTVNVTGVHSVQTMAPGLVLDHGVACVYSLSIDGPEPMLLTNKRRSLVSTAGSGSSIEGHVESFRGSDKVDWWEKYLVNGSVFFSAVVEPSSV